MFLVGATNLTLKPFKLVKVQSGFVSLITAFLFFNVKALSKPFSFIILSGFVRVTYFRATFESGQIIVTVYTGTKYQASTSDSIKVINKIRTP